MLFGTFIAYIAVAALIALLIVMYTKPNMISDFGVFMSFMVLIILIAIAAMIGGTEKYPYQPGQKVQVTNVSTFMYQTKHGLYTYNRKHMTFKTTSAKNSYIIIKRPQKISFGNALEYTIHKTSTKKTLYLNSHDQHKLFQH